MAPAELSLESAEINSQRNLPN